MSTKLIIYQTNTTHGCIYIYIYILTPYMCMCVFGYTYNNYINIKASELGDVFVLKFS